MEQWDPMKEDFDNEQFNSYSQGVGRDLSRSSQSKKGVCLFVQNTPPSLKKDGFYNLFVEYGKVLHYRYYQETTHGYITMENMVDAETAIRKVNNMRIGPYTLRVMPALTKEERSQRKIWRQDEERILSNRNIADDRSAFYNQKQTRGSQSEAFASSSGRDLSSGGLLHSQFTDSRGLQSQVTERGDGNYSQQINMPNKISLAKGGHMNSEIHKPLGPRDNYLGAGRGIFHQPFSNPNHQSQDGPTYNDTSREALSRESYTRLSSNDNNKISSYQGNFPNSDGNAIKTNFKLDRDGNNYRNESKTFTNYNENSFGSKSKNFSRSENYGQCQNSPSGMVRNTFNPHSDDLQRGQPERSHLPASLDHEDYYRNDSCNFPETNLANREPGSLKHQQRTAKTVQVTESWKNNDLTDSNSFARQNDKNYSEKSLRPWVLNFKNNKPNREQVTRNDWSEKTQETAKRKPYNQTDREELANSHNGHSLVTNQRDAGNIQPKAEVSNVTELSVSVKTSGLCYLTHFVSPYKFWISFDEFLEIFTDCTSLMRQEFTVASPTAQVVYKVGGAYAVFYMGDWCRVTILSIKDKEATIFYCDYGNEGTVNLQNLRLLTDEMLQLPAQAVCCTVSKLKPLGSESWSEAATLVMTKWLGEPITKFLQYKIVEKEGSIHAVEIFLDGVSLSDILLSGGFAERVKYEPGLASSVKNEKIVDQETPRRHMACTLPSKLEELKIGDQISVVLTDFVKADKFMALDVASQEVLNDLTLLLNTEYSGSTVPYRPIKGELVVAKFSSDGLWYRAEVISIEGDASTLMFVDFGNSEVQTIENIQPITNQKLVEIPKQAIFCGFHATKSVSQYGQDCVDIINKEFCTILASAVSSDGHTLLVIQEKTKDTVLVDVLTQSGQSLTATLTQRLSELSINMQQKGTANVVNDEPITKTLVSLPSQTKKTQQSVISNLGSETGHKDNANILKKAFSQEAPKNEFQQEARQNLFPQETQEKAFPQEVQKSAFPQEAQTNVFLQGAQEASHVKSASGIRLPVTASRIMMEALPTTGEPVQVMVTHMDSCSRLFISRKDKNLQAELYQMIYLLNSSGASLPPLTNVVVGSVCAAQFSQDKNWYRAQVVEICNMVTCIVHFVDYGNSEETLISNLRILKPTMMKLPAQAIGCCLIGFESSLNSDCLPQSMASSYFKLIDRLKTEIVERSFTAKVVGRKLDTYIVNLENELGESVGKNFQLSDLIVKTPEEKEFKAVICHINNLNDFCCQRFDTQELRELNLMSERLKEDIFKLGGNASVKPVINGVYACLFEGALYRCVVEEIRGSNVFIRYIDYGNSEEVSSVMLQPLNPERLSLPVRLLKCKIYGVTPVQENWNNPEMRDYLKLLQQYPVNVEIEGKEKDAFLVSLSLKNGDEKISVAADLVETGMAKFCQIVSPQKEETNAMQPSPRLPLWLPQTKQDDEGDNNDDLEIQRQIEELQKQLNLSKQKKNKK